jgi:hypothetical protein
LSDWWSKTDGKAGGKAPDGDADATPAPQSDPDCDDEVCDSVGASPTRHNFSPTKRTNFFTIGDDSDSQSDALPSSPRKRLAMSPMMPLSMTPPMGSPRETSLNNKAQMTSLRGICADYFENNVAPILRYVQQTQAQLIAQLKEVTAKLEAKADTQDVTTVADIEKIAASAASARGDDSKVAIHVRLEELATSMNKLKTCTKDQGDLEARVRTAEKKVASLTEELAVLRQAETGAVGALPETTKLKAVFAAAGLRYDKQHKEIRQQMQHLQDECLGKDVGTRWPGRKLSTASVGSVHSMESNESDRLSLGASAHGGLSSTTCGSMDAEGKAELRKIQAIVAAASRVFSKDLREVKAQMQELRNELIAMKGSSDAKIGKTTLARFLS